MSRVVIVILIYHRHKTIALTITTVNIYNTTFRYVTSCSLVVYQHFGGTYCLQFRVRKSPSYSLLFAACLVYSEALKTEDVHSSET
jgi:hypothetical protein